MTVNQSFQNWTVVSDEPGEQLVFEHDQTGERVTLDQDGSVTTPAVYSDDLNIGGSGFASTGTFFPVLWQGSNSQEQTSSSSYSSIALNTFAWERLFIGDLFDSDAQIRSYISCSVNPGGDQIDIRLYDSGQDSTLLERTGITTSGNVRIGPSDWTVPDRDVVSNIKLQTRNADNATTVTLVDPHVAIGIGL